MWNILLILSFVLSPKMYFNRDQRDWFLASKPIDDPTFTCYILQNNSWMCIEDINLKFYDPDDSY